jgi:hypothetical protein
LSLFYIPDNNLYNFVFFQTVEIDDDKPVTGIGFDGRNDWTKVMLVDENGKRYPSWAWEPGGKFLTHVSPKSKDAPGITKPIWEIVVENGIDKTLQVISGDSTSVNTGYKGGVMHFLEIEFEHKLYMR